MIDDFRPPKQPRRIEPVSRTEQPIGDLLRAQNQTLIQPTRASEPVASETTAPDTPISDQTTYTPPIEAPLAVEAVTTTSPPAGRLQGLKDWWSARPKNQKIVLIIVGLLVVAGSSAGAYVLLKSDPPKPVTITKPKPKAVAPKPTTVPSTLTGLQVQPEINTRPVTGIMVENSMDARPQSGLKDAGVVFEAIAEGGVTRFLALFQDTQPDYVGPVRSARSYYVKWLQGFDATYAHVGGSPEALQYVRDNGVKDLDQFYNSGSYQRVTNRYAPHNVYTSVPKLVELAKAKGYTTSTFTGFNRKAPDTSKAPNATKIDINISSSTYNSHYDYDAQSNTYKRVMGGQPHVTERSGAQLAPSVVVAMVMSYNIASDRVHSEYNAIGSGEVFVFQDGMVTKGTWSKPDAKSQITLTDAAGGPLKLNPGQTWIAAVAAANRVFYSP